MKSTHALISDSARYAVEKCPKCGSRDIRGPHDTARSATFLFTRAYFCRTCWWDRELRMKDDVAEAAAKQAAKEKKAQLEREKRRGHRQSA